MTSSELNSLALLAQKGCETSRSMVLMWYLRIVNDTSRKIWHSINNECNFEQKCLAKFQYAIINYRESKGNFRSLAIESIKSTAKDYVKNRSSKTKRLSSLESMTDKLEKSGNSVKIEPVDVLANVERSVLEKESVKERITLLAKGDPKKVVILKAWIEGYSNESELAQLLEQLFGGKADSHRTTIKRFRKFCQETLAESA